MYAPVLDPVLAPVALRPIGILDADLVAALGPHLAAIGSGVGPVLVDVRDLTVVSERDVTAFVRAIAAARVAGRDVRVNAPSLVWRRATRSLAQPPADPALQAAVRRTVIIAHSAKRKKP